MSWLLPALLLIGWHFALDVMSQEPLWQFDREQLPLFARLLV